MASSIDDQASPAGPEPWCEDAAAVAERLDTNVDRGLTDALAAERLDRFGPPAPDQPRGHGLDNMAAWADRRGGSFDIGPATSNGTVVEWRVPVG